MPACQWTCSSRCASGLSHLCLSARRKSCRKDRSEFGLTFVCSSYSSKREKGSRRDERQEPRERLQFWVLSRNPHCCLYKRSLTGAAPPPVKSSPPHGRSLPSRLQIDPLCCQGRSCSPSRTIVPNLALRPLIRLLDGAATALQPQLESPARSVCCCILRFLMRATISAISDCNP